MTRGFVGFVLPDGQVRPAVVVSQVDDDKHEKKVNLTVFSDWSNDGDPNGISWQTGVTFNPKKVPGTWHHLEN